MNIFVIDNENINNKLKSLENILVYYMKEDINIIHNDLYHSKYLLMK